MKLKEIMSAEVHVISPDLKLTECAEKMKALGVGALPICQNERIIGILTDRDIVIKCVAGGGTPASMAAKEIMSLPVIYAYEDEEVDNAVRLMEVKQVRRLIVLNRQKSLVGIVSLGDVATRVGNELSGEVLQKVSAAPDSSKAA